MCVIGRVFMQRRHNGRRQRHQHHEEEDHDPVSEMFAPCKFFVFAHTCILLTLYLVRNVCIVATLSTNAHCYYYF